MNIIKLMYYIIMIDLNTSYVKVKLDHFLISIIILFQGDSRIFRAL